MPVYEYTCASCGTFERLRPLREASARTWCPECGRVATKRFPVVNLRALAAGTRRAHEVNERSAAAPHVCGAGCSHPHRGRSGTPVTGAADRPTLRRSSKRNRRPWMLGH